MNTPPLNDSQKKALLREASSRLGMNAAELSQALQTNNAQTLKNRLSPADAARLDALLADESAMKALLARPELQDLLRAWDGKG